MKTRRITRTTTLTLVIVAALALLVAPAFTPSRNMKHTRATEAGSGRAERQVRIGRAAC